MCIVKDCDFEWKRVSNGVEKQVYIKQRKTTEVGMYRKARKKERKHSLDQESDQENDQEKKKVRLKMSIKFTFYHMIVSVICRFDL